MRPRLEARLVPARGDRSPRRTTVRPTGRPAGGFGLTGSSGRRYGLLMTIHRAAALLALAALVALPATGGAAPTAAQRCEAAAEGALVACVRLASNRARACYDETGAACLPSDAGVTRATARLE